MLFTFFLSSLGPRAFAAYPIDIEGIVGSRELFQLGLSNGLLQLFILELRHLATIRTDHVMVRLVLVSTLVLRGSAELMTDDQIGVHQQDDGIVERGTAYAEMPLILHIVIERVYVKMPLNGLDGIEYRITFGSLSMPVFLQILGQHLFYRLSYILFHTSYPCSAFKVKLFYDNLKV